MARHRPKAALARCALALHCLVSGACATLPTLTIGATSSLRAELGGAGASRRWTLGATVGWRAADRGAADRGMAPETATGSAPIFRSAPCAFAELCSWELSARSEALLRAHGERDEVSR
jgi:hypothetical protein